MYGVKYKQVDCENLPTLPRSTMQPITSTLKTTLFAVQLLPWASQREI